jgi:hypothetical protein
MYKEGAVKKVITFVILVSIVGSTIPLLPKRAEAFALAAAGSALAVAGATPQVPVGDRVSNLIKTVLNGIAIGIAQTLVSEIIRDTINFANSGFQGKPAYATQPGRYIAGIANGAAAEAINKQIGGNICAPFRASITLSIAQSYNQGKPYIPQCTLTGAVANYEGFMKDFSKGGWDSWFQITQNTSNNPYGALADSKIAFDVTVAGKRSVEEQKLNWGQGFLSYPGDCLLVNKWPPQEDLDAVNTGDLNAIARVAGSYPGYDLSQPEGTCLAHGPDKTPGTLIKSQLDKVMSGPLEQLTNVQQFDQLIGALLSGLLQRFVFGPQGLIGKDHSQGLPSGNNQGEDSSQTAQLVQCTATSQTATRGEDAITWSALSSLSNAEYQWRGDEIENVVGYDPVLGYATGTSISVVYQTSSKQNGGKAKSMTLTAISKDSSGITKTVEVPCSQSVIVSDYRPLAVSCYPSITHIAPEVPVKWTAVITGGSGKFERIQWDGQQGHIPKTNSDNTRMWPHDITDYTKPFYAWLYGGAGGGNLSTDSNKYKVASNGVTLQETISVRGNTGTTTSSILSRVYLRDSKPIGSVDANITVVDMDSSVLPVKQSCSGTIFIDD